MLNCTLHEFRARDFIAFSHGICSRYYRKFEIAAFTAPEKKGTQKKPRKLEETARITFYSRALSLHFITARGPSRDSN